ncbi:hypothetical protein QTP86_029582 [Hemibagrus guttatus]|nr:hypothetical protein QTP86_029582 [Hemibagrus guttatus]
MKPVHKILSQENHVEAGKNDAEYPKVVLESAGSDCNDSVTDEFPGAVSDEVLLHPTNMHDVNNDTVNSSEFDSDTESEAPMKLPTDARTVLKTQTHVSTIKLEGGEYYHFGLARNCATQLADWKEASMATISTQRHSQASTLTQHCFNVTMLSGSDPLALLD